MLKKLYYHCNTHFEIEQASIFSRDWVFACLYQEVKANNDYVTLDVAGKPVVIQNFKGEIRAFLNICTHRFNKIQIDDFGRRALTCGYHCWSFDKNGFPSFIPKKDSFPEFKQETVLHSSFCLTQYQIEVCGNFVFISLSENPQVNLKDFLGTHYEKLIDISNHMGAVIHFGGIPHKANWKILVENVLECYHCSVVHKESLYGRLGIGSLPISEIEYCESHSSCHFPKVSKKSDEKKRRILEFLDRRSYKHNSFYHIFIFPNLVISSTEGASFYVGQLFPKSAGETELRIRFLEPNIDYGGVNPGIRDALAQESINLGYAVLEEDRAILENIQIGVKSAKGPGIINDEEVRIKYFFDKYLNVMDS